MYYKGIGIFLQNFYVKCEFLWKEIRISIYFINFNEEREHFE